MNNQEWVVDSIPTENKEQDLGGKQYKIFHEQLIVQKHTQRSLKKIIYKLSRNKIDIVPIEEPGNHNIKGFFLDLINVRKSKDAFTEKSTELYWECRLPNYQKRIKNQPLKEKLYIGKECRERLLNIKRGISYKLPKTERKPNRNNRNYIIQSLMVSAKVPQHACLPVVKMWSTKLQRDIENAHLEHLTLTQSFSPSFNNKVEIKPLISNGLSVFLLLDTITRIEKVKCTKAKYKYTKWKSLLISNLPEEYFIKLERKLFDDQFNELEFYKIPLKQRKCNTKNKEGLYCLKIDKKSLVWKIDKYNLKNLNWFPFKNLDINFNHNFNKLETIATAKFEMSNREIKFNNIFNNTLHFIDSRTQMFDTYQLGLMDIVQERTKVGIKSIQHTTEEENETPNTVDISLDTDRTSNTSLIPQKRSILDLDLVSIIEMKKKSSKINTEQDMCSISDTFNTKSILSIGLYDKINLTNHGSLSEKKSEPPYISNLTKLIPIEPPYQVGERTIILNSNRLLINYSILQTLIKLGVNVIEKKINLPCDFILNIDCCIFRTDMDKFQQFRSNGSLYYTNQFKKLMQNFKNIIVIVDYNEISEHTDLNIFWKIPMFLAFKQFQIHYINNSTGAKPNHERIVSHILHYTTLKSQAISEAELETSDHVEREFLLRVIKNPFQVHIILEKYSFLEFINLIIHTDHTPNTPLYQYLTDWQCQHLKSLFLSTW